MENINVEQNVETKQQKEHIKFLMERLSKK